MIQLSRVELYRMLLESFGDKPKQEELNNDIDLKNVINLVIEMKKIMKINVIILDGIESHFFNYEETKELDNIEVTYLNNINQVRAYLSSDEIEKLEAINFRSNKDNRYNFNQLINTLNSINHKYIKKHNSESIKKIRKDFYKAMSRNRNIVFLSHAFDDMLYTFSLFMYFYFNGIFLYVDWMCSETFKYGQDIETNLNNILNCSDQLLFLRTVNSELSIRGSGNIRGWCSWELGAFYSIKNNNKNKKFYIELYNIAGKNNKQMDGIKPLKDIVNKKLV